MKSGTCWFLGSDKSLNFMHIYFSRFLSTEALNIVSATLAYKNNAEQSATVKQYPFRVCTRCWHKNKYMYTNKVLRKKRTQI